MRQLNVDVEKVLPYRIFTMERCIFCVRAKMLMNKHGIEYNEKHLSGDGLQRFKDVTKLNTLPQIYDEKDNHIGGYQELLAHLEN